MGQRLAGKQGKGKIKKAASIEGRLKKILPSAGIIRIR